MATTTATKPTTKSIVGNFYKVLTFVQPTELQLTVDAARVDSGATTLGETLKNIATSPSFSQSPAGNVARMFFLVFDRAPDATLFSLVMDALRAGMAFVDVCQLALAVTGLPMSNDGRPQSLDFARTLLSRLFGPGFDESLASELAAGLDNGTWTRHQLLEVASGFKEVAVAPGSAVETSLLYLAGASREATRIELLHASATMPGRVIEALGAGGLSATGGFAALTRVGEAMTLSSDLASDLVWDLSTSTFKLGGTTVFKVFYSEDEGLSGAVASFTTSLVSGTTSLDASEAIGKGLVTFVGNRDTPNLFKAPPTGSTAKGGSGDDILIGGDGVDVFTATDGHDVMTGGLGSDKFILAVSNVYQAGTALTTITDFGNGKDTLDLSRLLNKSVDISALVAVMATQVPSAPGAAPVVLPITVTNSLVTLVENNGAWVTGTDAEVVSRSAEAADVAALFGTDKLFAPPTQVSKSVVITADTRNSADVWLILNNTGVGVITDGTTGPQEVFHVAHLDGSWNVTLVGTVPVVLT
jgi:hypothetical protein